MFSRNSKVFAVVVTAFGLGASVAWAAQPVLVTAPISKVFVPLGFDDNDDVEIIVHGDFPNTCYKTGPISAAVDLATRTVTVNVQAYFYSNTVCAQVLVPFTQSVKVGLLPSDTYTVKVRDRAGVTAPPLTVAIARTSAPDDNLYAPVAQVSLAEQGNGQYAVTIAGEYPYMFIGCMVLREVRSYMSPGQTLVILPIAQLVDGPECEDQVDNKAFSATVAVGALAPAEYLIHTRALDGNSVNRFVDLTR